MNTIGNEALDVLFREAALVQRMARHTRGGKHNSSTLRRTEVGPDECQQLSCSLHFPPVDEGKEKASTRAVTGERRQNHDCPGYGDYRL
jgi:hypothetical protein